MQKFLAGQGYGASNLGSITFNYGNGGSLIAKAAFAHGNPAVTVGNNVYVAPGSWGIAHPGNGPAYFEEIIHSIQYNQSGMANFALSWITGSAMGALATGDPHDSPLEAQAIGISKDLLKAYNDPSNPDHCTD